MRCREIEPGDIDNVATLLAKGFQSRSHRAWRETLERLSTRPDAVTAASPGLMLEHQGRPVGVLLTISSPDVPASRVGARCNLSSWYAEPDFRNYAPLLVTRALRRKDVTFLNISSAPHTRPIIEAQGFSRYCEGIVVAMPALARVRAHRGGAVRLVGGALPPDAAHEPADAQILADHAAFGCVTLWAVAGGQAYPFVFRPRLAKRFIPCAQLVYCRDVADVARFAPQLGRHLLMRGSPFVVIDANGPVPGLPGLYLRGTMPKYYRGVVAPALGDLAYTETAIAGL